MDKERKEQIQRNAASMSQTALREHVTLLREACQIAKRRALAVGTDAYNVIVEELEKRVEELRDGYVEIDVAQYPNVVVAKLAALKAQEGEARFQLQRWKNAKETYKTLDEDAAVCENILAERSRNTHR